MCEAFYLYEISKPDDIFFEPKLFVIYISLIYLLTPIIPRRVSFVFVEGGGGEIESFSSTV